MEIKVNNYKNKEKELEQIIDLLRQEIMQKTKQYEILEDENLILQNRIEALEAEIKGLKDINNMHINKIKGESENIKM